ncbi:MFS transporter [Paenibacillus sp. Soil522]|uniref:MFS transporter n=1 Tax=Paenibacillus sp. Soil522 TaxID=1736388 RepID=UPI0006FBC6A8|nr:MFS transporter [Paenibacillus sp. Soil522]KRE49321.1 MFS transporter [Paenibacillus sp. Soil522]
MTQLRKPPSILRNRFFQAIMLSGLFLQIGIWVRNIAVLLFVMEQTDKNATAVSLIYVAEFAPIFIFSFIGGTFADRWKPKKTMIWCELLSAGSILLVLLALTFGSWKAVFFATLVSSILSQFSQPSGMKLFKLHVPEELMQTGISMYQTLMAVFMIAGPLLGTFIYKQFEIEAAIGLMGIAFILSAAVLTLLPPDREAGDKHKETILRDEMALGLKHILSKKVLMILGGCFAAAGLGVGFIHPMAIFLVTERLGLPEAYFQWLQAANGIGMFVGGGLAVIFSKKISPPLLLLIGLLVNAASMIVSGVSIYLWLTLAAQFFIGLVTPGFQVAVQTMILKNTEESFMGRVNGILGPLFLGSFVLTMSTAGWMKPLFSVIGMYVLAGTLFIIGALITIPLFRLRPDAGTGISDNPNDQPVQKLEQSIHVQ